MAASATNHDTVPRCSTLPDSFIRKKAKILKDLSVPLSDYDDLSPKGSIDVSIRDLINEINTQDGFVTTSSCGGRVSVFLEGIKKRSEDQQKVESLKISSKRRVANGDADDDDDDDDDGSDELGGRDRPATLATVGGKGGGGMWLYVSHDPVCLAEMSEQHAEKFLGMDEIQEQSTCLEALEAERLIHFKFEPMILHILTASLAHAQVILTAAFGAGFRESGALNLYHSTLESETSPTPIVAIRTMGLSLESIIGYYDSIADKTICCQPNSMLKGLVRIANQRFLENGKRIERFTALVRTGIHGMQNDRHVRRKANGDVWEDVNVRRDRKRAEGLRRAQLLKETLQSQAVAHDGVAALE